jgi:hypothetical protein
MVHALEQTWRVLHPAGLLVDIHPATFHARVGHIRNGSFTPVGPSRFPLTHYRDANLALRQVQDAGLFRPLTSEIFDCMTYGSPVELAEWITESDEPGATIYSERLVERAMQALRAGPGGGRVAVQERILLRVLEKPAGKA